MSDNCSKILTKPVYRNVRILSQTSDNHQQLLFWPACNRVQCSAATLAILAMMAYCFLQLAEPKILIREQPVLMVDIRNVGRPQVFRSRAKLPYPIRDGGEYMPAE